MDELKQFLKDTSADDLEKFAEEVETSVAYLRQLAGGHRKASTKLARRLNKQSGGRLSLEGLRPDIWGEEAA